MIFFNIDLYNCLFVVNDHALFLFFSVSFVFISIKAVKTLYGGQFTSLPQWIKANDLGILLHRRNTTVSLKLTPFYLM